MSDNSFGTLFRVTTWGESHGPAIGCVVDGVPPRIPLAEAEIQTYLDKRRPGTSRFVTQRRESDHVTILSGVFEGKTTGTPIAPVRSCFSPSTRANCCPKTLKPHKQGPAPSALHSRRSLSAARPAMCAALSSSPRKWKAGASG